MTLLWPGWCGSEVELRKMQIKTTMRYHYTPIQMAKIEKLSTCVENVQWLESHCWWEHKIILYGLRICHPKTHRFGIRVILSCRQLRNWGNAKMAPCLPPICPEVGLITWDSLDSFISPEMAPRAIHITNLPNLTLLLHSSSPYIYPATACSLFFPCHFPTKYECIVLCSGVGY